MSKQYIGDLVLSQEQIKLGVSQVAQQLNQRFAEQDAVIISVVPGGILFTADIVRELTFDISMDYISCPHTPGDRNNSSEIVFHQNIPLTGRNVILVDDAIESGGTMKRIAQFLQQEFVLNSLSIATLFVKPGHVDIPVTQHHAYVMENDDLLVGYGLPWQDQLRNIPYVSKLVVE
ncbi:hypoxanthine phosphoribosyltransferase [Vibrio ponticus]|uniref:Hypoxanthine phosphoribosyltransferase n=1 Tax=Vibrio ponticus TaxID=265668 RepID=A0A3N3DWG7_9VIBR|nr:phosphoribosyltransferase family protein [Vibrio ponticus]ROV58884.1 hypoxanthine phosphoribosyltransferase [Vibrio ponticus]